MIADLHQNRGNKMPLSTTGICHHIVSSLKTYRQHNLGTCNDCKVVLNHLIRKLSEPLERNGRQKIFYSEDAQNSSDVVKEHLVPVNVIMKELLSIDLSLNNLTEHIENYLERSLTIVIITRKEDELLNKSGLQRSMPECYFDNQSDLYLDRWARYKCTGIYDKIIKNK